MFPVNCIFNNFCSDRCFWNIVFWSLLAKLHNLIEPHVYLNATQLTKLTQIMYCNTSKHHWNTACALAETYGTVSWTTLRHQCSILYFNFSLLISYFLVSSCDRNIHMACTHMRTHTHKSKNELNWSSQNQTFWICSVQQLTVNRHQSY